jgi:glycine cleavage system H protein
MSDPTSKGGHQVIPPDELRCVWMEAGVLSYQLCERQCDCDRCPLDVAIRMHPRGLPEAGAAPTAGGPAPRPEDGLLRRDRRYSRERCWVMPGDSTAGGDLAVRVGLEPGFAAALLNPRSVVLPEPGAGIQRGTTHVWVVTEGHTFGILAPVSGTVVQANGALQVRPHILSLEPQDAGWLYTLQVPERSPELATLMSAGAATRLYQVAASRLHASLHKALRDSGIPTPPREGDAVPLQEAADALGQRRYFSILQAAYV